MTSSPLRLGLAWVAAALCAAGAAQAGPRVRMTVGWGGAATSAGRGAARMAAPRVQGVSTGARVIRPGRGRRSYRGRGAGRFLATGPAVTSSQGFGQRTTRVPIRRVWGTSNWSGPGTLRRPMLQPGTQVGAGFGAASVGFGARRTRSVGAGFGAPIGRRVGSSRPRGPTLGTLHIVMNR